ncbi:MAG: ATP phosphoribosyltransferase [Fibrobacterota bacterium]
MLQIALPNKGSLSEDTVALFREAGYSCRRYGRELAISDTTNDIDFFFLRPRDIAVYVGTGVLDIGITGRDLYTDSEVAVEELLPLGFGKSSFYYALPAESTLSPDQFSGMRIATSYANLVRQDLSRRGVDAKVVRLDGAVEISIRLGVADAIADVVESGRTLKEAGLKTVGDPLMRSEAVVIARSQSILHDESVRIMLDRLKGIIVAREYAMIEYDIPEKLLDKACEITPGIESPTIAPLSEKGWMAVKSMTRRKGINRVMDKLAALGAKGIIVSSITSCRI